MTRLERKIEYKPHPIPVLDLLHARIASPFMLDSIAGSIFSLSGINSVRKSALLLGEGASETCGLNTLLLLKEKEHKACEFCVLPRLKGEGWGEVSTLPVILLSSHYSELPFNASRIRQGRDEVSTKCKVVKKAIWNIKFE